MEKTVYVIFFLFLYIPGMKANLDFSSELITVSQGLPNPQVNFIHIGKQGLMWIGTTNGLCLYDGYNFSVLQSIPFDSTTFADDNIKIVKQGRLNNIWLYTSYGIEHLDVYSGKTSRIKYFDLSQNVIVGILPSNKNDFVYLVGENFIEQVNIKTFKIDRIISSLDFTIIDADLFNGEGVFLTNKGIYHFNLEKGQVEQHFTYSNVNNGNLIANTNNYYFTVNNSLFVYESSFIQPLKVLEENEKINSLTIQCNNIIAYSTDREISIIAFDSIYRQIKSQQYLMDEGFELKMIIQDEDCLVWAATGQGLIKINPYSDRILHKDYKELGINSQGLLFESGKKGVLFKNNSNQTVFYNSFTNSHNKISIGNYTSACLLNENNLLIGNGNGVSIINLSEGTKKYIKSFANHSVHSIRMLDDEIWISTDKGLYMGVDENFNLKCSIEISDFVISNEEVYYTFKKNFGVLNTESCIMDSLLNESNSEEFLKILDLLQSFDGKIWLATDDGLYRFNPHSKNNQEEVFSLVFNGKVFSLIEAPNKPEVWFSSDMGIGCINYQDEKILLLGFEDGIRNTSFIPGGSFLAQNGYLGFLGEKEITILNPETIYRNLSPPTTVISKIQFVKNKKSHNQFFLSKDTIVIKPEINYYELSFATLNYFAPRHTTFNYSLVSDNKPDEWSKLELNTLSLGNLNPGNYTLKVKAINSHGVESDIEKELFIVIKAPIFQSKLAILLYGLFLIFTILLVIRFRTRNLMRVNKEYKEKERIAKKIEQQKEELTIKNKNITDSISYARRIQLAMMPSVKNFKALFPDSFILHMPKDIVSGDFYWVNKFKDKTFFSAVDCTGHGVPGAFMSIIGVELFRRITEIEKIYTPAEILNSLSKNFDRVFGDVDEMKLRDGMDLAFCTLSKDYKILEYAGAFNPLYIIRDNSIIEVKADRYSVGVFHEDDIERSFNNHVIPIHDQDLIYIFTDGFADQFGGPEEKKYKYRRFRHLLLALHQLPMEKQEEFLKKSILEWKGTLDQVDDILVMGIRIHQQK